MILRPSAETSKLPIEYPGLRLVSWRRCPVSRSNDPEILLEITPEQCDDLLSARQKTVTLASSRYYYLGQGVRLLLWRHRLHCVSRSLQRFGVEDQAAVC
jgi:hypothetical protein